MTLDPVPLSVARKAQPYFDKTLFHTNCMGKAPQRVLLVCRKAAGSSTGPDFCFKPRIERGKGGWSLMLEPLRMGTPEPPLAIPVAGERPAV